MRTGGSLSKYHSTHHGTVSEELESSEKAYLRWDCGNPLCAECGLAFAAKTELDQYTKEAHDGENHYDDHRPECERLWIAFLK
jgi:hypothetical protein